VPAGFGETLATFPACAQMPTYVGQQISIAPARASGVVVATEFGPTVRERERHLRD
jgi:hypothetical protein